MHKYYEILGISENATRDEIQKAFYMLAKIYHPDKYSGTDQKFKEINTAYQILTGRQQLRHTPMQSYQEKIHFTYGVANSPFDKKNNSRRRKATMIFDPNTKQWTVIT